MPNLDNRKLISFEWIFKKKKSISNVKPSKYNARLLGSGYTQREVIDFIKIFSLVVKHSSIIIILAMVPLLDIELEQMDVKTTFLH